MPRAPELQFDFVSRYEVTVLERIERSPEFRRVLDFPGAHPLDSQRELSAGVILAVRPGRGEPWLGVFELGTYGVPPAAPRQVLGWPDEWSLCVVVGGAACVVRTDDPAQSFEIDCFPVCDVLPVSERGLVVFADFQSLIAYDAEGVAWRTTRLAWDDVQIVRVEDDTIYVSGYDPTGVPHGSYPVFTVDLRTGHSADKPYLNDE